jgi:hypothetical protein
MIPFHPGRGFAEESELGADAGLKAHWSTAPAYGGPGQRATSSGSVRLNHGSLYSVIGSLERRALIEPTQTSELADCPNERFSRSPTPAPSRCATGSQS